MNQIVYDRLVEKYEQIAKYSCEYSQCQATYHGICGECEFYDCYFNKNDLKFEVQLEGQTYIFLTKTLFEI